MYLPKSVFDFGFVFYVLHNGGHLYPLEIGNLQDYGLKGWNCMNPSVMFFGGKLYFSVRCVNYTLFNSDYFPVEGQPTIYCETEGNLRTVNFIGTLDANNGYAMKDVGKVDIGWFNRGSLIVVLNLISDKYLPPAFSNR